MNKFTPGLVIFIALFCAQTAAAQEPSYYNCSFERTRINIPAMPLGEALARFTEQTRCPVSVDASHVGNKNVSELPSYPVKGRLTSSAALKKLLSASPLKSKMIKGGFSVYQ